MLSKITWHPDGRICNESLPGHSVSGLMYYWDPFVRYDHRHARRTLMLLASGVTLAQLRG